MNGQTWKMMMTSGSGELLQPPLRIGMDHMGINLRRKTQEKI
jgi:hypothetical protein